MANLKIETNEAHLNKVKKKCSVFHLVLKVIFFINITVLVGLILLIALDLLFPSIANGQVSQYPAALLAGILSSVFCILILRVTILIFKDISNGITPFSSAQVKRIRLIALFLLLYSILETLLPMGLTDIISYSDFSIGYFVAAGTNEPSISINIGALIAATIVYCVSVAMEYGIVLQNQSDEIL